MLTSTRCQKMINKPMRNPYKIVQRKDGRYAVEYKDYPHVGIPDSWGTKSHATAYMAALLGLTVDEMRRKDV